MQTGQSLHGTVGSPFYIAPEVLAGSYDQAADVWSAGVILYILLSGIPPFWGKTKSRIFDAVRAADLQFPSKPWDAISNSAKELIEGMLCTDTSRRLTAEQVLGRIHTLFFIDDFHNSFGMNLLIKGIQDNLRNIISRDISICNKLMQEMHTLNLFVM